MSSGIPFSPYPEEESKLPIQGLTTTRVTMPPVIGYLRKGGEKETKISKKGKEYKGYGSDLEYFRFTARNEQDTQIVEDFLQAYGAEPQRLEVYLPAASVDDVLMAFKEEYNASKLIHRCDGHWIYQRDRYSGEFVQTHEPCPYGPEVERPLRRTEEQPGCRNEGRLALILPELVNMGHYGVVTALTHSINDIANLYRSLADCEQRFGSLSRIPFYLYRAPERITTPNGPRREKWLLYIQPASEFVTHQLEVARTLALSGGTEQRQLQAPPQIERETLPQEEKPEFATCEECQATIPHSAKATSWAIADWTKKESGKAMCKDCFEEWNTPTEPEQVDEVEGEILGEVEPAF